jgi:hypothetical protein
MIELDIIVKDEKDKLIVKDTIYGPLVISLENSELRDRVEKALDKFGYDPNAESPSIVLKFKLVWQS